MEFGIYKFSDREEIYKEIGKLITVGLNVETSSKSMYKTPRPPPRIKKKLIEKDIDKSNNKTTKTIKFELPKPVTPRQWL